LRLERIIDRVDLQLGIDDTAGLADAAPVFGVPAVAAKGELNILAAGPAEAVARVQPLFDALGQKT